MTLPAVIVITDWSMGEEALLAQLARAGRVAVQHRNPGVTARVYFEQAVRLKAQCDALGAELFVSGRLDVALALGTHLHLPARAVLPADVKLDGWVSVAVHDEAEAGRAQGADLALLSPVFETGSKPDATPLGPEGFARLAKLTPCPAYALGGLTPDRLALLPSAAGAAVISAVLRAEDPAGVVAAFARIRCAG